MGKDKKFTTPPRAEDFSKMVVIQYQIMYR